MEEKRIRKIKSSLKADNYRGVFNLLNQYPPIPINFENNWILHNFRKKYSIPNLEARLIIQSIWENLSENEREQHLERMTFLAVWAEAPGGELPFLEKILEDNYRPSFYFLCTFRLFEHQCVELVDYLYYLIPKYYDLEKEISELASQEMTSDKFNNLFTNLYIDLTFRLFFLKDSTLIDKIPKLAEKLSTLIFGSYYHYKVKEEILEKCLNLIPRLSKATVVQTIFRTAPDNITSCVEYHPSFGIVDSVLLINQVANLEIEHESIRRNTEVLFRYTYTLKDINEHYSAGEYQCVTAEAFDNLIIYPDTENELHHENGHSTSSLPHQQHLSTKILKKIITDMFIDYHFALIHLSWEECILIFYKMCPWFETFCEEHLTSKLFQIHTKSKNLYNRL